MRGKAVGSWKSEVRLDLHERGDHEWHVGEFYVGELSD